MKIIQNLFLFLVLCFSIGFINPSFAQSIYFCEGVDDDGEPINESSVFTIPEDGGFLYVLVQLPYEINCHSVSLEIYRNDDYDNTITVDTKNNWTWFWKKINFYKSGEFTIDVYDCNDDLIISGSLDIDKD
jgi:hypothetical protein